MDKLNTKQANAQKALKAFSEALKLSQSEINRDVSILRFQFTTEAVWKYAQNYLKQVHSIEEASPKKVMRALLKIGVLDENETSTAIAMTEDRNLVVHTYNEMLADSLYAKLKTYFSILAKMVNSIDADRD